MLLQEEIATVLFYILDYQPGVILPPSLGTSQHLEIFTVIPGLGEGGTAGAPVI